MWSPGFSPQNNSKKKKKARKNANVVSPWLSPQWDSLGDNLGSSLVYMYTHLHSLSIQFQDEFEPWYQLYISINYRKPKAVLKVDLTCWWPETGRMIHLLENCFQISQCLCHHGYRSRDRSAVIVGKTLILIPTQAPLYKVGAINCCSWNLAEDVCA